METCLERVECRVGIESVIDNVAVALIRRQVRGGQRIGAAKGQSGGGIGGRKTGFERGDDSAGVFSRVLRRCRETDAVGGRVQIVLAWIVPRLRSHVRN